MMNLYWPVYQKIEKEVIQLTYDIHVDDKQLTTYSGKIADLILRISTEIESISKDLYLSSGGTAKKNIAYDYVALKYLNKIWSLDKKIVMLSHYNCFHSEKIIHPFVKYTKRDGSKSGEELTYTWNNAYQNIKHNRVSNLEQANLQNLFSALSALYVLNLYFKKDSQSLEKDSEGKTLDEGFGSTFFSVKVSRITSSRGSLPIKPDDFEESIYYISHTSDSRKKMEKMMSEHNQELTSLISSHPKFQEAVADKKIFNEALKKGGNIPWNILGQEVMMNLYRQVDRKVKLDFSFIEYEANINKHDIETWANNKQ